MLRVGQTTFEIELLAVAAATKSTRSLRDRAATVADAPQPPPTPCLLVLAGPKQGEEIPLGDELLIGRSFGEPGALGGDQAPVAAPRANRPRSGRRVLHRGHRVLERDDAQPRPLRRAQSLKDGDEIEVGSTRLEAQGLPRVPLAVELDEEQRPASPAATPGRRVRSRSRTAAAAFPPAAAHRAAAARAFPPRAAGAARRSPARAAAPPPARLRR